ncbi:MAG: non-homologous end-joining DNA ligase [Chloroflexi bacterium]|nr:non-homologous end-joining DNA ligase [Chloroflexota bacterium]
MSAAEHPPSLKRYAEKRDFARTSEPPPHARQRRGAPLTFTIQKHAARRLHYDVRLEIDGVLVSWAVPQGPSFDPSQRRLAIQTEDHPYDYGTFEGQIPAGEYGAGEVIVWDAGTYAILDADGENPDFGDEAGARKAHRQGHLRVFLNGRKLKGGWTFARSRGDGVGSQWMLIKRRDGLEKAERDVTLEDHSVLSGLRIEDIAAGAAAERQTQLQPTGAQLPGSRRSGFPKPYEPMLPTLTSDVFQRADWLYEPKLDGYRALAFVEHGAVRLWSRNGQAYEDRYPEVSQAMAVQPVDAAIFDGEVVAIGADGRMSFQRLQQRASDPDAVLRYYVFDLLYLDGYDLREVPLTDRKQLLHAVLAPIGAAEETAVFDDGLMLFRAAQANRLEGIVAKKRDSLYEAGRRVRTWLKMKTNQADEFVIAGYTLGTGRRTQTLGSLVLASHDANGRLRYAGHVGTGFDEAGLHAMLKRLQPLRRPTSPFDMRIPKGGTSSRAGSPVVWVEPVLVAEIKFAEQTADGRLRHPVFLRLREDKPASEVHPQVVVDAPESMPKDQIAAALDALSPDVDSASLQIDGHSLRVTNLKKEFWPAYGERRALTKGDLVRYYLRIAPFVLPHLRDRPVTMTRFPNGIHGSKFYQKSPKETAPAFVDRFVSFSEHNNSDEEYFVCNNVASLVWLAQVADLELHVTHTRISNTPDAPSLSTVFRGSVTELDRSTLNYPDFLVVDLDPYIYSGRERRGEEPELNREGFFRACEVAGWFREMLESVGLHPFIKTTGKTGLHLYVPIARTLDYDSVRALAETFARRVLQAHPDAVTMEWAVNARTGKVFLDYNMNRRSASLAAVYSPRAIDWAGVSTPLAWDELEHVYPTQFDILNVPERLARLGDLWAHILDARVDLKQLLSG